MTLTVDQVYTVGQKGQLCIWECDTDLDGLIPYEKPEDEESDEDEDEEEDQEKGEGNQKGGFGRFRFGRATALKLRWNISVYNTCTLL